MKRIIIILFLISFNSVFTQNFKLNPKFSFLTNTKYSSKAISLELSYDVTKLDVSLGLSIGLIDMYYDEYDWSSVIEDYKLFYGFQLNYYPIKYKNDNYLPFIGLKTLIVDEHWFVLGAGGNHVFFPGYYFPSTEGDMIISPLIGSILYLGSVNLIVEFEYEFRYFNLKFDEYNYADNETYLIRQARSIKKNINSVVITFGVQIKL